jgi:hypothetical protein
MLPPHHIGVFGQVDGHTGQKRVLKCFALIKQATMKLRGRESRVISKASAAGMPLLSPQGWVHGDFAFTLLSLSRPPDQPDNLLTLSSQISLSRPPDQPDNLLTLSSQISLSKPPDQPDNLLTPSGQISLTLAPARKATYP